MLSSVIYSSQIMDNLPQHPSLDPRKQELLEARFTGNQRVCHTVCVAQTSHLSLSDFALTVDPKVVFLLIASII